MTSTAHATVIATALVDDDFDNHDGLTNTDDLVARFQAESARYVDGDVDAALIREVRAALLDL